MILALLVAASAAAAPAAPAVDVRALLAGADHAVQAQRLDQASLMLSRAIAAGASGLEVDRVRAALSDARGDTADALARYQALLKVAPTDKALLESAGMAALKLGRVKQASALLASAIGQGSSDWRVWNACGVAADDLGDWDRADQCYAKAVAAAPSQFAPLNNRGWSRLLRGDWHGALDLFERAAAIAPNSRRAANNLELARSALAAELPQRLPGETLASWAARLNDAGVAASLLGDKQRATAAFTQALDVKASWYARAANNLKAIGTQ